MGSSQVDIKRNEQPTPFGNKLQLIIYSSTTNFHTGERIDFNESTCETITWIVCNRCTVFFSVAAVHFTYDFELIAAASTVIYGRDKLGTNGKIMFQKVIAFFYINPYDVHIASWHQWKWHKKCAQMKNGNLTHTHMCAAHFNIQNYVHI